MEKTKKTNLLTFDRYFLTLDRPLHHKAGMEAFAKNKIKQKRTASMWNKIFANY